MGLWSYLFGCGVCGVVVGCDVYCSVGVSWCFVLFLRGVDGLVCCVNGD